MQSNFYLVNKSFEYKTKTTVSQIENRIRSFSDDYDFIRQHESEVVLVNSGIYEALIYPNITVAEFLGFSPNTKQLFNKQIITYLNIVLRKSKKTSITTDEVIEILLNEQSENELHGLMCLFEVEGIDPKFLVYNKNNWLSFHRYFLQQFLLTPEVFFSECKKYFPNLIFHPNILTSLKKILRDSYETIIKHLIYLNDILPICIEENKTRQDVLKQFNSSCDLDSNASPEGNIERKSDLTFDFQNNEGINENIYCELHLKLVFNDNRKVEQNRIYFHEGKYEIGGGKILIGHIGRHL
ncbi:hypothetical protein APR41_06830 [Salegentibacter salinarum]|uniref:Uncharacterized protein n=1 Tax=Salegentibacter salinarum TaxID=447422 RepID=A0A2N0TQX7_9FLAO|nr:hypothetical protein [Salegentibacter salinarum]PKD17142.1 hypothetical protein APR41_06830 [Salegentibacter salinarum]SKB55573.1 hypothetical protein SAMN05660903_01391 [Salegentibacter salinarum]